MAIQGNGNWSIEKKGNSIVIRLTDNSPIFHCEIGIADFRPGVDYIKSTTRRSAPSELHRQLEKMMGF